MTEETNTSTNPLFNLSHYAIGNSAQTTPDKQALEIIGPPLQGLEKATWTYRELDLTIRTGANGLISKGIEPGTFLLLRLNSNAAFVFGFFSAIAAGLVPIPLSPSLQPPELKFFLTDTGASWMLKAENLSSPENQALNIITEAEFINLINTHTPLKTYAPTHREDPAYLITTSGTTNKPKGVLHAQRTICGRTPMRSGWHDITSTDRVLHAGDYNWTYTLGLGLMDAFVNGATALIVHEQKSPQIWPKLIATHKATIFAAVPGVYRQILKYAAPKKENFTSLRHCLSAGETLPSSLKTEWETTTGIPIYEALGQSEISTYVSTAPGFDVPKDAKGRIQRGRTIAILPEKQEGPNNTTPLPANKKGLIAIDIKDPGLMLGYWQEQKQQPLPRRGNWFLTGDIGSIDENNNLTHHGRADDIMNAQGYRVSPQEVESALMATGLLKEAAVFEKQIRPDLSLISALIIPKNPGENETTLKNAIFAHLKTTLANYKHPKEIKVTKTLPHTTNGKLQRHHLATWVKSQK